MEIKKIGLLIMALLIMISGGVFVEVEKVEACKCVTGTDPGCAGVFCTGIDPGGVNDWACSSDGSYACWGTVSGSNISVCLIGSMGSTNCSSVCPGGSTHQSWRYCFEDKCGTYNYPGDPGDKVNDPATNGIDCRVTTVGQDTCSHHPATDGNWDYSDEKCVLCGGDSMDNTEVGVYGDSSDTYIAGGIYTITAAGIGLADNHFESACGADASCDEKIVTEFCNVTGRCDKNGICCMLPKILDAGNNCVDPPDTAMILEISMNSNDNPMMIGDTNKNVKFKVTKASDDSDVVGANVTIDSITCGTLPNPGLTNGSGIANSDFDAPAAANICIVTATATKGGLDDATATYAISVLSGSCISGAGGFKIAFDDDDYVEGDTVEVNAFTEASDPGGCVRLYYPSGTGQDTDFFDPAGVGNLGSASEIANAGEAGTWYGGLFFGACGSYATADCQVETIVGTGVAAPPACIPAWNCGAWGICDGAHKTQTCIATVVCASDYTNSAECCRDNADCVNNFPNVREVCDLPPDGVCVECLTTPDCISLKGPDFACDIPNKKCVLCKGEGETATAAHLCCYELNWLNGICTSACDPNAWFFCNPLRTNVETLAEGGERIVGYILGLIGSVALLLIVISGAMYMTSAGSEEKIASSKKILTAAVIGLGIALLAYSLLLVIMTVLGM